MLPNFVIKYLKYQNVEEPDKFRNRMARQIKVF